MYDSLSKVLDALSASLLTKSAGDIKNPEQGLIMCTRPVYL